MGKPAPYRTLYAPRFERDLKRLRRNASALEQVQELVEALKEDSYNRAGAHDIRKLTDVRAGEGQWRIRSGDYRVRYDIEGTDVILYCAKPRKESY